MIADKFGGLKPQIELDDRAAGRRTRILFFAEPATLAHVARPVVLADTLNPAQYDVTIATGPDFKNIVADAGFVVKDLLCIGSRAYLKAISEGQVAYSYDTLQRYVVEDLRHINAVKPDIIVGDFRLSLAVSARLSGIPYIGISNAYWSPYVKNVKYEVPVHAATRLLGSRVANHAFRLMRPFILGYHSLPMHRLFRQYGMPSLGWDLRRVFTEADVSVFADIPEMVATKDSSISGRYAYIGPVVWSPRAEIPSELTDGSDLRPLVYITMGSSGDPGLLDEIVRAMVSLGCRVAAATSGALKTSFPNCVVTADLLPGSEMAARAKLVICNGGSPSTHQALQQGVPVLGIPSNMDQLLNMSFVVAMGAGLAVRADEVSYDRILNAAQLILKEREFSDNAQRIAGWFRRHVPSLRFPAIIEMLKPTASSTSAGHLIG